MEVPSVRSRGVGFCWELGNPLHWGACLRGRGGHSVLVPSPTPFSNNPGHRLPSPKRQPKSSYLIRHLSQPGAGKETTSLHGRPQPLVCLVHQSRGHVSANFVAAFIKWGFTGALSSISGLVGELNKMVRDAGAAPEKIFVSQRMELASLPHEARQAGRRSSWRAGPLSSFSQGRGVLTCGNLLQHKQEVGGRLGPPAEAASGSSGKERVDPQVPFHYLSSQALLGTATSLGTSFLAIFHLPMPFSSHLPFLLAFFFLFVSFLFFPQTPLKAFCYVL